MRGGIEENVTVVETKENSEASTRQIKALKPRNSDAVLSCPCCFNIVCMDCQRHTKYTNQFRAMFVMGVTVDWHARLIYDEKQQALIPKPDIPKEQVPEEEEGEYPKNEPGEYFSVLCLNCHTQVAALDMNEELYYFHGCLESS